jgi:hypothetical protein
MGELLAASAGCRPPGWSWTTGGPIPAVSPPRRAAGSRGSPGWQSFLRGAGIDATDPQLPVRVRCLQVLRMVELLAGETSLAPEVRGIVADRLRAMLR